MPNLHIKTVEHDESEPIVPMIAKQPYSEGYGSVLDAIPKDARAVILEAFATGTVPSPVVPRIREFVHRGTAVFLIGGASKTDEPGIMKVGYGAHEVAMLAGAVHLERINIGHVHKRWTGQSDDPRDDVVATMIELAREHPDMFDLIDAARKTYALTDDEIRELERQSADPGRIPIEREAILRARSEVDKMLHNLREEREREHTREQPREGHERRA